MKLSDLFLTEQLSGELARVRKLFVQGFKTFLGGKSRELRLDFIEEIVDDTLNKAEIKFLILALQKGQSRKKKKKK